MADPTHIYHWYRLDDRVTTSGQPSEPQLTDLFGLGVRHVINLAPHSHATALPDEQAAVERLGLGYSNIPVDFKHPAPADFRAFCSLMEGLQGMPVHIHCAANYRVAAFVYRYRREVLGVAEATARADLEAVWRPDAVWSAFIHVPFPDPA